MRDRATADRVRSFLEEIGRVAPPGTRIYLTGGATAVLEGWRESTVDVDIRIEPEDDSVMRRLVELKEELSINVELASPPDFIPELPGWRDRSPLIERTGAIEARHFDPYSQALSKIERGFDLDLEDVREMLNRGLIEAEEARKLHAAIEPELHRYPAIDPAAFASRIREAFG